MLAAAPGPPASNLFPSAFWPSGRVFKRIFRGSDASEVPCKSVGPPCRSRAVRRGADASLRAICRDGLDTFPAARSWRRPSTRSGESPRTSGRRKAARALAPETRRRGLHAPALRRRRERSSGDESEQVAPPLGISGSPRLREASGQGILECAPWASPREARWEKKSSGTLSCSARRRSGRAWERASRTSSSRMAGNQTDGSRDLTAISLRDGASAGPCASARG